MPYGASNLYDESWWHRAAGHECQLIPKVSVRADVCEVIYLKYMFGVTGMPRIVLWFALSFFRRYPKQGCFDDLNPRGVHYGERWIQKLVRRGIDHLYIHMHEISMDHTFHPNNHIPHFPWYCLGSIDTFPIRVPRGRSRYQPKYSGNVVKFQAIVSHLGLLCFLLGPHPGSFENMFSWPVDWSEMGPYIAVSSVAGSVDVPQHVRTCTTIPINYTESSVIFMQDVVTEFCC